MQAFPGRARPSADLRGIGHVDRSGVQQGRAEIGSQSVELAEEFALTTAELSYLPDRRRPYDNLAKRCGHPRREGGRDVARSRPRNTVRPLGHGAARHGAGKPRNAHAGSRKEGGLAAREADRADDRLLPAVPLRHHSRPGRRSRSWRSTSNIPKQVSARVPVLSRAAAPLSPWRLIGCVSRRQAGCAARPLDAKGIRLGRDGTRHAWAIR